LAVIVGTRIANFSCAFLTGTIVLTLSILLVPIGSGGLASQHAQPHGDEEDGIEAARYA
jgi:hypothetical protein